MTFDVDAKMPIAMAKGNMMNIRLSCADMSFREFGEFCSKPQQGGKHEAYFIRGVPVTEEKYVSGSGRAYYDGKFRHDDSLWKADFLIIDADNSKADSIDTASALDKIDLIYFLYTTHSHSENKNNFRVVLPCKIDCKANLEMTALTLIADLKNAGLDIEYVREMGVWSQAWFLPTRDDPNDGLFQYYENMIGEDYVQSRENRKENCHSGNSDSGVHGDADIRRSNTVGDRACSKTNKQSIGELIEIMRVYGEGCHNAMLKYSHMLTSDGVAKKTVIVTMQGIMSENRHNDKRTETRYNEIERIVEDREGIGAEIIPLRFQAKTEEKISARIVADIDWPPGLLGELCQSAYNFSLYPDKTISLVASLGLMAGIAGRRFNIGGSGLNLYLTLLMDTGGGKSVIGKFIRRVLNDSNIFIGGDIFIGSGNYTGPKAIMDDLLKKRCMISVFTEAGFMFRSRAGDKDGLTRSLLDLYGCSGYGCYSSGANYSSDKNHIPAIASPCFSLINESTPEVFLQALKDGAKTGEINRMNIFRLENPPVTSNRNHKFHVDPEILDRVKKLMTRAAKTQKDDDPDITNFIITSEMYDFADKIKKDALDYREDDYIRFSMMQRSAEKTFKLAALCTVLDINAKKNKGIRELNVSKEAWEWALKMYEYEMRGINDFFRVDESQEMFGIASGVVYNAVSKILNAKYKDPKLQPKPMDRKRNRFPLVMLRFALKNCRKVIEARNLAYKKDGFDVVLDYLKTEEYIKVNKIPPDAKKYIIVNPSFLELGEID